jgi:Uma2 family endonuclease
MASDITLLSRNSLVARREFTVDEYHRMGEAGVLPRSDRIELIEGDVLVMSPVGSLHVGTVIALTAALSRVVGESGRLSVQSPLQLDNHNEPEPDVVVLRPRDDFYRTALPRPADALLVVEVADSSLTYDQSIKVPLYARHGIPEVWIVDLAAKEIEVCRSPVGDRYTSVIRVGREGIVEIGLLPGTTIAAAELLG